MVGNVGPGSPTFQLLESYSILIIDMHMKWVGMDTYASQQPCTASIPLSGVAGGGPAHSLGGVDTHHHRAQGFHCYPRPQHSLDDSRSLVVTTWGYQHSRRLKSVHMSTILLGPFRWSFHDAKN